MDDATLLHAAQELLAQARARRLKLAAAESCTGGLIAATLARVPGASAVLERGFVTYSNDAKAELLRVPPELIERRGAVSKEVAQAMAEGALAHAPVELAIAVTGIAGPDGGAPDKPVGLVHIAAARKNGPRLHQEMRFGAIGREKVQRETVAAALALLMRVLA
jgi:nicotinamide-nucleotide amidase